MNIKTLISVCCLSLFAHSCFSLSLEKAWEVTDGLARPESVVYDAKSNRLLISNINGAGRDKDGNGYISQLSLKGDVIAQKWASGLDAPKGSAIFGSSYFVADINTLVEIDLKTGDVLKKHTAKESGMLNDVTADKQGNIYTSDTFTNRLYRLQNGTLNTWLSEGFSSPNGLIFENGSIYMSAATANNKNGREERFVQRVEIESKKITHPVNSKKIGVIDGIKRVDNEGFILSDVGAAKIYFLGDDGKLDLLASVDKGSADIEYIPAERLLIIPFLGANKVEAYTLSK